MNDKKEKFSMSVPFDHAEVSKCLAWLEERYRFLELHYIGNSVLGKSIPAITFGGGSRRVLYVGAHHGMEWLTSMLLCRFLSDFSMLYESGGSVGKTPVRAVFATHTITVIPMLNPDGVDYQQHGIDSNNPLFERLEKMCPSLDFSHWQANARGVDLNHNYDAGFGAYKQLEKEAGIEGGCATRFSGEAPESEPETAALCNWIRFQSNLRGVMTLHTQGEEIYYQSGGICPSGADAVARRLAVLCGYRPSCAEGLASYGGLTDWCIRRLNIPAFTVECGKGTNPLPTDQFFPIYVNLRNALFAFPTLL